MENLGSQVVYQVYPKSFNDSNGDGLGDIQGIIEKLDYLCELGIDYLWITPVFLSPQRDNGYDVADYCRIDPRFGTMADMEELIAESGRRGIGLMLDMVFNHTSTEHLWFKRALAGEEKYQNYYFFKEGTPDSPPTNWQSKFGGSAWEYVPSLGKWYLHLYDVTQADLNWDNQEVRDELKKVVLFWKSKGVRGFRFDVVNLISKPEQFVDDEEGDGRRFYSDGPHIHEYLQELTRDTGIADMITVGEMSSTSLENCISYSNPRQQEMSMCFHFHHLKVDYRDGDKWKLMEPDRMALKNLLEKWQIGMQEGNGWNALFWCNHDQPRIVSRFGDEKEYWKASAKMLAACIQLMRGTPYIYQGEELGMTNPHYRDISQYRDVESLNYYRILRNQGETKEKALSVLAARSRDNGRTPMQWNSGENAGFTRGTPWIELADNAKEIYAERQRGDEDSVYSFYRKLIYLRKHSDAVAKGSIAFIERENPDILGYVRRYGREELVVFNNLTAREVVVKEHIVWSDYRKILGNYGDAWDAGDGDRHGRLRPFETVVLEYSCGDE